MHNFGAELFLSELNLQCQLFNRSIKRLESAAEYWHKLVRGIDDSNNASPLDIVADCTVCLSAMAAIRRILCPAKSDSSFKTRRANALLQLLENPRLPNVTSVNVRNSWEHFDERLDDYLSNRPHGEDAMSELHISPRPPSATTTVLRRFDPTEFAIHFGGHSIPLQPCIDEVELLSQLIDKAYLRLQHERVDI